MHPTLRFGLRESRSSQNKSAPCKIKRMKEQYQPSSRGATAGQMLSRRKDSRVSEVALLRKKVGVEIGGPARLRYCRDSLPTQRRTDSVKFK